MTTVPVPVLAAAAGASPSPCRCSAGRCSRGRSRCRRSARDNLTRGIELPDGRSPAGSRSPAPGASPGSLRTLTPGTGGRAAQTGLLGDAPAARRRGRWPGCVAAKLVPRRASRPALGCSSLARAAEPAHRAARRSLVTVVAYFLPELLLYSRGQERQEAIGLELADTLDQMTIAVEAGLGFESAHGAGRPPTARARSPRNWCAPCRTSPSASRGARPTWRWPSAPASTDLAPVHPRRRPGRRSTASPSPTCCARRRTEMRLKRRQRAEEKAMQIPVKVIFPLILCILPTLFIVLLGPAVMDIGQILH